MRLRKLITIGATAFLAASAGLCFAPSASAATNGPSCYGSVGCTGSTVSSACIADEVRVEQLTVPGLGQLVLYKSPVVCNGVWAQLTIDTGDPYPTSRAILGYEEQYQFVAEIFYEPPTGGPEQFDISAPWDGTSSHSVILSPMLPDNASFKACAGAPSDAAGVVAAFDEDPQGIGGIGEQVIYPGLSSTPTSAPGGPATTYSAGACTLWH
jgi:hypothetical protein